MTVKELQERLREFPPDLLVEVEIGFSTYPANVVYMAPWNRDHTVTIGCSKESLR